MGQEILYCSKCQTQLRSADFEKGSGVHLDGQPYCKKCAREAVKSLSPEKHAQLLKQAEASKGAGKFSTEDLLSLSSTDRILSVMSGRSPTRRFLSSDSGSGPILGVLGAIGAGLIGILILLEMSGGGSSPPTPEKAARRSTTARSDPPPPPSEATRVRLDPPRDPAIPALPPEKREEIAKESLRKSREYAAANPSDFAGQHSRFEEAAWDARETSLQEMARAELRAVEKRELESFSAELSALDAKTQKAQGNEEFGQAMALLEEARKRHPGAVWLRELDARVARVNDALTKCYASVKEKALEARRRGAQGELEDLRGRVKKWDMPGWVIDVENSPVEEAKPAELPKSVAQGKPTEPAPALSSKSPAGPAKPGLLPVPDAARQRDAEAAFKKSIKLDPASTPREKAELARSLLTMAASSGAKDAELYVLLRQARNLAMQGGEVKTALEAINALGAAFEVDVASERTDLFGKAAVKGRDAVVWASTALDLAGEASEAELYDTAIKLADRAESLARAANDRGLQNAAREAGKDYTELKRIVDGVKAQTKTLETHPEDAAASSAVGKYACLIKGDWKGGLALMAKGSDPDLKNLAELELGTSAGIAATAGTPVQLWIPDGSSAQDWKIAATGDGFYTLTNAQSGMDLSVSQPFTSTGLPMVLSPHTSAAANAQWSITSTGSGTFTLINRASGMALDAPATSLIAGTTVMQWTSWSGANQQWKIPGFTPSPTAPAYPYALLNLSCGLALDATGVAAQGALGEAWLTQAGKESSVYKSRARARGAEWLGRAIPGLTGMAKIAAERKLASLGPPDAARGRQVLDLGGGVKLEFVPIKPGAFVMGGTTAPDEWHVDERPMHRVVLNRGFAMGKYLVTRGQWAAFVKATGHKTDGERNGKAWGSAPGGKWEEVPGNTWLTPARFTQTDDHPAVCISWNDATAFCDWATKVSGRTVTLPTEAEWEYVCRAGTRTRWWFGDQEAAYPDTEWCSSNSGMQTHPVGQKKPNPWGIYDMNGNVHVWCQDFIGPYSGDAVDPTGPTSGEKRIFRGGCWKWGPSAPSSRSFATPSNTGSDYGFRVCLR